MNKKKEKIIESLLPRRRDAMEDIAYQNLEKISGSDQTWNFVFREPIFINNV